MMWQGYMVHKSSRGPRIGHSNDKNTKFSGALPRTPLGGGTQRPKTPTVLYLALLAFRCKQKLFLFIHLSLDSGTACLRAGPFTTLPTELCALNGRWVPMSGRKLCLLDMMSDRKFFVISGPESIPSGIGVYVLLVLVVWSHRIEL